MRLGEVQAWTYAIQQSCLNKAAVVAADEREGGVRATLNLGHTFGHAIETGQGYGGFTASHSVDRGLCLCMHSSNQQTCTAPQSQQPCIEHPDKQCVVLLSCILWSFGRGLSQGTYSICTIWATESPKYSNIAKLSVACVQVCGCMGRL